MEDERLQQEGKEPYQSQEALSHPRSGCTQVLCCTGGPSTLTLSDNENFPDKSPTENAMHVHQSSKSDGFPGPWHFPSWGTL